MKKTNFTLLSKTFKMCAVLLAFGFYSISSFGQFIDTPGIACGTLGDNVLDNPSFEDGPGDAVYANNNGTSGANGGAGNIQDWSLIANGGAAGGWGNVFVETPFNGNSPCFNSGFEPLSRSGNRNVKMFSAGGNFTPQISSNFHPAVEGETWVSSIYVLSPSACNDNLRGDDAFEVQVLFYDAGQALIGFSTSNQFTPANADDAWHQRKAVATAPVGTAFVNLKGLIVNPSFGAEDNGAVHLDDASLRKVTPVTPVVIEGLDCGGVGTGSVTVPVPTFNGEEIPHTNPFVPTLVDDYCAGDFSPLTFTNDFNGVLDASGDYPIGTTIVSYVANDGNNNSAPCALFEVVIVDGSPTNGGTMVCNDLVNISITEDGCSLVGADAILEGNGYGCIDQFEVIRVHDLLDNCSPDAPNGYFWVGCSDVGTTITLKVVDPNTGNYCWGDAHVEDKEQPTLECDVTYTDIDGNDQVGTDFNLICSEDPNDIDLPNPVDNCDRSRDMTVNLISEVSTGDLCTVLTITKVYQSADKHGNKTNMCTHTINITQPSLVTFPDDITWACDQYAANPGIVDATALNATILRDAADIDVNLLYCGIPGTEGDDVADVDPYYPGPSNILSNGGFEMGDLTDWTNNDGCGAGTTVFTGATYNNGFSDVSPTEGNSMLVNEFTNPTGGACASVTLRQNISVPATGAATLTFDYNAAWNTTCAGCLPKLIFFEVIEVGVGLVFQDRIVEALPGTTEQGSWQSYSIDLTSYAGKDIEFQFVQALAPAAALPGHFALDNFQLLTGSTTPYWEDGEDLDVNYEATSSLLRNTGSGEPNVVGSANCKFAVVYSDRKLEACDGVDTTITFKILRTWTILNWCTGLTTTDVQIIKVIDKKAPVFDYPYDHDGNPLFNTTLLANQSTGSGNHAECASSGLIPVPIITDDCSGVAEIRAFTPAGEGVPVYNNAGDLIGFSVPSPFLDEGDHEIVFQAIDACGNNSRDTVEFEVVDGTPPTPICRELTQISVSSEEDGVAVIYAADFDEGSYDYCGPVYFKVRRMDDNCSGYTNDRRRFNDEIHFCCDDIGDNVNVILRVYDVNPGLGAVSTSAEQDHANDCMVEVLVEDKVRPECYAPEDVWINCNEVADNIDWDDDFLLDDLYGSATVLDNCSADLQYVSTRVNLDLCGVGTVTRTFRAEDTYGNRSIGSCRQVIMVQPVIDYCITVPADYEGECDNNNAPDELTFVENGCDLLAVSSEEEPFNAGGPAGDECRKVIKTWKVINWCEYDGIAGPTRLERDRNGDGRIDDGEYCSTGAVLLYTPNPTQINYPSTGYYEWHQHVKIFDNTAPEVSYDGADKFCGGDLDEDPCTGQVDIELTVNELCTDKLTTTWAISAFSSTFNTTDFNGSDAVSMRLPLGTHTVRFQSADDCGNVSQYDLTFSVVDCKAPTPVCHNGLSIDVMPLSGMVELWANDFDASSFDYCSDFILRANVVEDTNGDGIITSDDYVTVLPPNDYILVDCDDVANGITMVQLWVAEQDGTADDSCADNQDNDFCVTFVEVQDNNGVCSGSKAIVDGKITTEDSEGIENVELTVNDGGSMVSTISTDATGGYQFSLPIGGDYSVTPMRNDDAANGVSTFDLVLISKHILNVSLLNSAYKVLAADANRSGGVSTLDLVAIRKVVLRLTNEFPNNTSWRFVEKSHIFSTANNPWTSTIPEVRNINDLTTNELNVNFVGIKVGDVNGDVKANGILGVDDRTFNGNFEFQVEEQSFKAGEEVAVTFTAAELEQVEGYQFTLKFNNKSLDLVSIENGVATAENFGTAMASEGYITTSWNGTATDETAFTAIFLAKAAGTLSNEIAISSELTSAEAYVNGEYKNVSINFGGATVSTEFALHQNTPNPFKAETVIGFDLPTAMKATLTVSEVSGKILKVVGGDFAKGYNTVTLSSSDLTSGVLYYQIDTDEFTATKKMVVIK